MATAHLLDLPTFRVGCGTCGQEGDIAPITLRSCDCSEMHNKCFKYTGTCTAAPTPEPEDDSSAMSVGTSALLGVALGAVLGA